jgi:hypothetical protein
MGGGGDEMGESLSLDYSRTKSSGGWGVRGSGALENITDRCTDLGSEGTLALLICV